MASIRFNQIADARGSVNGTVYSRGIGGLYMKNRVSPLNPQSSKQSAVRSQLSSLAAAWRSLTDSQRNAWKGQVDNYPATNRLGETYTPSGYQLYMTLNSNLNAVNATNLNSPLAPASFSDNKIESLTIELTAGVISTGTLSLGETNTSDEKSIVEMTGALSAGVSSPSQGLFRRVLVSAGSVDEYDISTVYAAQFGTPPVGARVFARCVRVLASTGQRQILGTTSFVVTSA